MLVDAFSCRKGRAFFNRLYHLPHGKIQLCFSAENTDNEDYQQKGCLRTHGKIVKGAPYNPPVGDEESPLFVRPPQRRVRGAPYNPPVGDDGLRLRLKQD